MWMASASYWQRGVQVYAYRWSGTRIRQGEALLKRVLAGVGEPEHERLVLNATALFHSRRLTEAEIDAANLRNVCAVDPAGTPLRVIWERGESFALTTQPCERGGIYLADGWLPQALECGVCPSCVARSKL